MQGAPDSLAVYCVATQDELVSLDNAVATEGGTARAYMDDVAVVATPHTGFMAHQEHQNHGRRAHRNGRGIRPVARCSNSRDKPPAPPRGGESVRRRV